MLKAIDREVSKFFPICPFCSEPSISTSKETTFTSEKHIAVCNSCGAKWHIYLSNWTEQMSWAALLSAGTEGGEKLLNMQQKPDFWRNLAFNNKKKNAEVKKENTISIIKEKEVVVKIRCAYCRSLFDESFSTCPKCGASH